VGPKPIRLPKNPEMEIDYLLRLGLPGFVETSPEAAEKARR
jgi:hypothetical protein